MRILAFDQTIANTGWCVIVKTDGLYDLDAWGTFKTAPTKNGVKGTIDRSLQVYNYMEMLLSVTEMDVLAYELPSTTKAGMQRTESSLVAACMLHLAWDRTVKYAVPLVSVQNNKMKKHVTGNGRATKQEVGAAVKQRLHDDFTPRSDLGRLNEHIRDAIGIALTVLEGVAYE